MFLIKGLFIWRWTGPVRQASSTRWDHIYPTFIWNLLPQFKQKVCYIAGKKLFDQVVFIIDSDAKPSYRTNVLILFNIWKTKQSWLKKSLSHLAGLAHLHVFIWKIFILPWWNLCKIKWNLAWAGWLTSHMNTFIFL